MFNKLVTTHQDSTGIQGFPEPVFFDSASQNEYLDFLDSKDEDKIALVGLWNCQTNQFVFKKNFHHKEIAEEKGLTKARKKLKPNWYGFICALHKEKQEEQLGVIPKSAYYHGIPLRHGPLFEYSIKKLFSPRFSTEIFFVYTAYENDKKHLSLAS